MHEVQVGCFFKLPTLFVNLKCKYTKISKILQFLNGNHIVSWKSLAIFENRQKLPNSSNEEERELSLFLYHLTQEIIGSRDYSDCNINQICSKYYNSSSYPNKERLRRLVTELKRKLKLQQQNTVAVQAPELVQCRCSRCKEEALLQSTALDQCVGTSSMPWFGKISEATQFEDPVSYQMMAMSAGSTASSFRSVRDCSSLEQSSVEQYQQGARKDSSNESDTLIEQVLLRHAGGTYGGSSSDALLRMAAADHVFCDSCHGKCPLQRCQHFTGGATAGPSSRPRCGMGDACRPTPRKVCKCPLKQCGHFDSAAGGGCGGIGGCTGCSSDAPLLRQDPGQDTPPVTCCGRSRRRRRGRSRSRSRCRDKASSCRDGTVAGESLKHSCTK